MKKRLVLIDGHAVVFRAFYAFPTSLTARDGEMANAVFGFSSILLSVIKELKPSHIAVTFDLDKPTFRHKDFAKYKAQRPKTDEDLKGQIGRVKEVVRILNIPIFEVEGFEADDVIGTLCKQVVDKKMQAVVVTGDQDAMQLVNGNVKVFVPGRGKKPAMMYGEKEVRERYGFEPIKMIDFKALSGDSSDNIPGIKGIGPKTALDLIKKFGSVEGVYEAISSDAFGKQAVSRSERNDKADLKSLSALSDKMGISRSVLIKLIEGKEEALQSKMLATIRLDVPIKLKLQKCELRDYDKNKAMEYFLDLGFPSIANRLPGDEYEEDIEEMFVVESKTVISSQIELFT